MSDAADHIVFEGASAGFGDRLILNGLDARVPRGRITAIVGGSGVGKSTLLRVVGGLVPIRAGRVLVDGTDIAPLRERGLAPVRRKLGMMFQAGALLDSLSVFDNVAFPLREHTSLSEAEIAGKVTGSLGRMGLSDGHGKLPGELSGGMRKRVALARAMITEPVILLCDEPFSGLDPITAKRIELLLLDINREVGMTIVLVSHDPGSTRRMAHHVLVLLPDGSVQGTPEELAASADPRVANLLATEVDERVLELDDAVERGELLGAGGAP